MDISIQNVSRPASVPNADLGILSTLTPAQIGLPDSGVSATLAGTQEGQQIAQPLANVGEYLEQYYTPQAEAARKASIANSNLETTNATQQNSAAQATPNLPLAQRSLALSKVGAEQSLVQPQTGLALSQINSEQQQIPGKTQAAIAGNALAAQTAANTVNATPNVPNPDEPYTDAQAGQNAQAQSNALARAKEEREVAIAANPFLQVGPGGGLTVPEGHYIDGGKLMADTVATRQITGPDGKIYTTNVWAHSGQPVSTLQDQLSARNATIQNMQQRFGAMNGVVTPGAADVYNAVAQAKSTDLVDPATGQPANIPPALVQPARKIAQQFTSQPDVQNILKATPNINNAINNFQQSMNAQTGVESVEALNEAGRAFRGAVPTNEELNMLLNTAGLPAKADNLVRSIWNGDPIAPEQKQDYMSALQQLKQSNDNYIGAKYNTYVKSLDTRMQPYADQLFPSAQQFLQGGSQGSASTNQQKAPVDASQAPVIQPTDKASYDKLPNGAAYKLPDGTVYVKGQ